MHFTTLRPTMNKLRKPKPPATISSQSTKTAGSNGSNPCFVSVPSNPPVSRTMQIASASLAVERTSAHNGTLEYAKTTWLSAPAAAKPRTHVEQYWAARALVAETVLTTRVQHQKEMAEVRLGEEEKRTNQIAALVRANEQRQSRLEKFVVVLVACFMLLFLVLLYMLVLHDSPKSKGASHFTIPILSPFTSVVEHEIGAISARSVSVFIVVLGVLSYAIFRHWFSKHRKVGW
ncbi:uncharacterized protein EDB91DRAFT_482713 [Suillus paluster]|uniref:uncharacterized protein n=1 Tax=Suillus paluster TaxID=48578 RepID=UPI001B8648BE|nr:uncharacterized protein EDB91DRAFT_482713 [Suillus paluster]KAG1737546.1 hypothetical protein EDB91DRAFT_482713 [Suillus paluster]